MNQVEAEPSLEELLDEAVAPFLLARGLGDFASFLGGRRRRLARGGEHVGHREYPLGESGPLAQRAQQQRGDVALALIGKVRGLGVEPHRLEEGSAVDQGKPGQRDQREQEVRCFGAFGDVHAQLLLEGREGLLPDRGAERHLVEHLAIGERFPLDEPDEVWAGGHEVGIIGHRAGQDDLGAFPAGERALPAFAHRPANILEAALEDGAVERRLRSEEVARGGPGDPGRLPDLGQAGFLEALLGEELLGGLEDDGAGSRGDCGPGRGFSVSTFEAFGVTPIAGGCSRLASQLAS